MVIFHSYVSLPEGKTDFSCFIPMVYEYEREIYIYIYKKPFYGCKIVFMEKTTNMALAVQGDIKLTMLIFQTIVYKMVSTVK